MQWMSSNRSSQPSTALPGVIETIGNAFAILNKRPYFLVLPVIVDVFLWVGYRLSLKPLTETVVRWMNSIPQVDSSSIDRIRSAGDGFNLFELLAVSMPNMVTNAGAETISGATHRTISSIPWWLLPELALLLLVAGVAIGVVYLTLLAFVIRGETLSGAGIAKLSLSNTIKTIGYVLLVAGIVLLLSLPVIFLSGVFLAIGISIVPLTAALFFLGAVWAYVFLYFAQDAIIISGAGPARAIYLSYNVVRSSFWPCVGLMFVSLVIQIGTPLALTVFTRSAWGVPLAFVIHAYILTGLAVAAMMFYRDRAGALRGSRPAIAASERTS